MSGFDRAIVPLFEFDIDVLISIQHIARLNDDAAMGDRPAIHQTALAINHHSFPEPRDLVYRLNDRYKEFRANFQRTGLFKRVL
jgi:hypothetical protein